MGVMSGHSPLGRRSPLRGQHTLLERARGALPTKDTPPSPRPSGVSGPVAARPPSHGVSHNKTPHQNLVIFWHCVRYRQETRSGIFHRLFGRRKSKASTEAERKASAMPPARLRRCLAQRLQEKHAPTANESEASARGRRRRRGRAGTWGRQGLGGSGTGREHSSVPLNAVSSETAANTDRRAWAFWKARATRPRAWPPGGRAPESYPDALPTPVQLPALLGYACVPLLPTGHWSSGRPGPLTLLHEGGVGTAVLEARGLGSPTTAGRWCAPPELRVSRRNVWGLYPQPLLQN